MNEPTRRCWFRFSLRTLLVAVTLLCCWLGWETSIVHRRRAVLKEVANNPAFQIRPAAEWVRMYGPGARLPETATVPLVRRLLGDEAIQTVWYAPYIQGYSEAQRKRLEVAFPEAEVSEGPPLPPCHPGCFPRGTLVETPLGARPIETLQPGEPLNAFLPSGQQITASVQSVFVTDNRLWEVATTEGVLLTTETQPLCLAFDRIVPAGELQPGDMILRRQDGAIGEVKVLSVTRTGRVEKVYNLVLGSSEVFVAGSYLARSKPPAVIAVQ